MFDNGIKVLYIYGYYILGYIIIYIHYIQYDSIIGYMSHDITGQGRGPSKNRSKLEVIKRLGEEIKDT